MRILWITNSPFPEVYKQLNLKAPVTVGWVHSAAKALLQENDNLTFAVASFHEVEELKELKLTNGSHFLIPKELKTGFADTSKDYVWKLLKERFKPDVIHIHGSEYPHSYAFVRACGPENVVLSIQGLVSVIERYYYGDIREKDILKTMTLRDLFRFDTLFTQRSNMRKRGEYERMLMGKVNHFIGRTSWDRDHTWAINPDANYYFCNETLRPSFYHEQWAFESCDLHSIFISQAHYPIKGLHQLIKALPIVLQHFPNTKVYVAGNNFFTNKGMIISGYGNYINRLIRKYNLFDKISFTGLLSESEMCQRFLRSHVFVSPSAIENSPNSLGEAQLLGVPCIASYVGGTPDMVTHHKSGLLFRFEEYEMLAASICQLFANKKLALVLSAGGKNEALRRHDRKTNAKILNAIYSEVAGLSEKL